MAKYGLRSPNGLWWAGGSREAGFSSSAVSFYSFNLAMETKDYIVGGATYEVAPLPDDSAISVASINIRIDRTELDALIADVAKLKESLR
jgi:hypothetical protein